MLEKTTQKCLSRRIQQWVLLGPFIMILALLVSLVKTGDDTRFLASLALVGGVVCWKWKMRGLWSAIVALTLYTFLTYSSVAIEERFWHVGFFLTVVLTLVVTTLSLEEVETLIRDVCVESESRLESLWKLDEKLKQKELFWQGERKEFLAKLQEVSQEVDEKVMRIHTFERMISIVRQDLEASHHEHDALLEELFAQRTMIACFEQQQREDEISTSSKE